MTIGSHALQTNASKAKSLFVEKLNQCLLVTVVAASAISFLAGCGGGMSSPPPGAPIQGQNTTVTLFLSTTANDRLSAFQMAISSVTLTSKTGNTVTLYQQNNPLASQVFVETMHANGNAEPLATVSIPQDLYTAASVTVTFARFSFVTFDATTNTLSYNSDSIQPNLTTVVMLPSPPLTISGNSAALSLDLQVAKSAAFNGPPPAAFAITPVFNLSPVSLSSQPTSNRNGKATGIHGQVSSVSPGGSFSLALPDGPTLNVASDSTTVFQGIGGFSSLTAGMFIDIDSVVLPDGLLKATRIEAEDPASHDVMIGPVTEIAGAVNAFNVLDLQQQGSDFCCAPDPVGMPFQLDANTVFRVSGQFSNLQSLPFTASFNAANMVVGQNVSVSTATISNGFFNTPTTVTLVPQTINATVNSISSSGGFTIYNVTLAPYDLIPTLTGTSSVVVYAGGDAQVITSSQITAGSVVRFHGLLFNDNGTLRMVAGQVSDGVAP